MTVLQITCDNCGAKYKLPESFPGTQAKCQKCQSIIDVAKQRAAAQGGTSEAAKPASAAKPAAAAKPAVDRSKAAAPASKPAAPSKPAGKAPARGKAAADDGDDRGIIKPKKASMMPIYLSAGGLLVIVLVVVVMMTRGGDKPKTDTTAKAPDATKPADKPTDAAPNAADPAAKPADAPAPTPAAKPAKSSDPLDPNGDASATPAPSEPKAGDSKPADAAATEAPKTPEAATPAASGAASDEIVLPTGQKIRVSNPPASMDKVTDPKSYPEVVWPPSITDEAKTEARDLVETAATDDGVQGLRAIRKLESLGHPAVFAIVERLRLLDYKSIGGSQPANTLNRALQNITKSFAGYAEVRLDWEMTPAIAEFNTRTVKKWIDALAKFQTAADLQKAVDAAKGKAPKDEDDK